MLNAAQGNASAAVMSQPRLLACIDGQAFRVAVGAAGKCRYRQLNGPLTSLIGTSCPVLVVCQPKEDPLWTCSGALPRRAYAVAAVGLGSARFALAPSRPGAAAVGAGAVGALAIGRLAVGRAVVRQLRIEDLEVKRLHVEELQGDQQGSPTT